MTLDTALEQSPELRMAYTTESETKKLLDLARKTEGVARHASVHAAGVVIADKPLTDYTPLQKEANGDKVITQGTANLRPDGSFKRADQLREMYTAAGVTPPITAPSMVPLVMDATPGSGMVDAAANMQAKPSQCQRASFSATTLIMACTGL